MALRVRYQSGSGQALGYAVERLADGLFLDFADGTFTATPGTPVADLTEGTDRYTGLYRATLDPTPVEQFPDGEYQVTIHDTAAANALVAGGLLSAIMHGGDDTPFFPGSGVGGAYTPADVWNHGQRTLTDRTGFVLSANGLDALSLTESAGPPTTVLEWLTWLIRWFGGNTTRTKTGTTSGTLIVHKASGVPWTTQATQDDGAGNQSHGAAT